MKTPSKVSISEVLGHLKFLPCRTPEMSLSGGAGDAFARLSEYRDGAIYVGHYSGDSEWERHSKGEEIVIALEGRTTLVLFLDGREQRVDLSASELIVVPRNAWHRFEHSREVEVLTVTPQPTDHSLDDPSG